MTFKKMMYSVDEAEFEKHWEDLGELCGKTEEIDEDGEVVVSILKYPGYYK